MAKPGRKGAIESVPLSPQLCEPAVSVPAGDGWLHEVKLDGYRILCVLDRDSAEPLKLITRGGQDWTNRFPALLSSLPELPVRQAVIDGEVVILDRTGHPDFQALQNSFRSARRDDHSYFAFDLLYCDGFDLRGSPLIERKRLLKDLLARLPVGSPVRFSSHVQGHGQRAHDEACRLGIEGIVSKQALSAYSGKRTSSWRKIKCSLRQEFVIGGHTPPEGTRRGFGALLVGTFEGEKLIYRGRVGTGFTEESLAELTARLDEITIRGRPFDKIPRQAGKGARWVEPKLACEVEFTGWTNQKLLRHASFKGLREDKPAATVSLELSAPARRLTHPDRILFPEAGLTKQELHVYYMEIAPRILPFIERRPLMVLRCPGGRQGQCFHQKHLSSLLRSNPVGSRSTTPIRGIEADSGKSPYLAIDGVEGLLQLVQLNAVEFHPWASREDHLEQPRYVTFDLDPGPGLEWNEVVWAAKQVRDALEDLGLRSFVKTTGGKGLHVVAPLTPKADWAQVKAFAKAVAVQLARQEPSRYVTTLSRRHREGKVFIDYLRNGRGATSVAPYSTRARPHAPISVPIAWEEIDQGIRPNQFNPRNLLTRLASREHDPWEDFFHVRQSLTLKLRRKLKLDF